MTITEKMVFLVMVVVVLVCAVKMTALLYDLYQHLS